MDNRPILNMVTINAPNKDAANQPQLAPDFEDTHFVSTFVNKSCVSQGYTGLATSIINEQGIINISSVSLSQAETSFLAKGLSFCPNTNNLDFWDVMAAMDKFHSDLRLRHFFSNAEETYENPPSAGFEHKKIPLYVWAVLINDVSFMQEK